MYFYSSDVKLNLRFLHDLKILLCNMDLVLDIF